MKQGIVDRFEGKYCVVEINGLSQDILIEKLPTNVEVGDTIVWSEKENMWVIDRDDTAKRQKQVETLIDELFED